MNAGRCKSMYKHVFEKYHVNKFRTDLNIKRIHSKSKHFVPNVVVCAKELLHSEGPDCDIARAQRCLQYAILKDNQTSIQESLDIMLSLNARARDFLAAIVMLQNIYVFRRQTDDDRELLAFLKQILEIPISYDWNAINTIDTAININDLLLLYTVLDVHADMKINDYLPHVYKCLKIENYLMATIMMYIDLKTH